MTFKMTAWRWSVLAFLLILFAVVFWPGPDIVMWISGDLTTGAVLHKSLDMRRRGWTNVSLGTAVLIVAVALILMFVLGAVLSGIGSSHSITRHPVPATR
jgi:hypothetical protein